MGNTQDMRQFSWLLVSHPILRNSEILPEKNMIKTTVSVLDQYQIQAWLAGLQKIKSTNCPYLFTPSSYAIATRAMCGTSCTVRIKYENYPYILMEEIINRCKIDRKFEENELWYLLYVLTEVANNCLSIQGKIGDVRPHNILFNQSGQIKVMHRYSYPGQITNFEKTLLQKIRTFLSPEEMRLIYSHKAFNNSNFQLSESFSIGMTLLCAFFLEDMSYLYDLNQMVINQEQLKKKLEQLPEMEYYSQERDLLISYSQEIISIVSRLLDINPGERLSSIELQKWLKPFSKEIVNFQEFKFEIIDRARSFSGYQTELNRGVKKNFKHTMSLNKSEISMEPMGQDLGSTEKLPQQPKELKAKFTRKFTISQKALPFEQNLETPYKKSQKTYSPYVKDKSNNVFFNYINHSIAEQGSVCSQKQNYPKQVVQQTFFSQEEDNQKKEGKENQNQQIFSSFASQNKILSMKDRKNDNHQNQKKLTVQDLEDYHEIRVQNKNIDQKLRIPQRKIDALQKFTNMEEAAISANSGTPINELNSQHSLFKNSSTPKHPQQYSHYISSHSGQKSNGMNHSKDDELLLRLDEQLKKSQKMFPVPQ